MTQLFHIERERWAVVPDAWVHVTWFGLAIRLWARMETRYAVERDEEVTKRWRRYLVIRFKPRFRVELYIGI